MTLQNVFAPTIVHRRALNLYRVALPVGASLFIALSAQLAFRLPFSLVPFTLQTLAVLLTGVALGSRMGAASVLLYLAEGAMGLPVFAQGGAGIAYLLGPTGGYLFGFVLAAYLVGWLAERSWDRHIVTMAVSLMLGNVVLYACGLLWLNIYLHNWTAAMAAGLMPFIVPECAKMVMGIALAPSAWAIINKLRSAE
jgi:biotin transport system substrate-specific component